ncbi:hypothetical protein BU26DRAFT_516750 [Trematosphaeria pertusa]|uniref:Uncharacterized protein n=1 Tax=Trematosphaeria pertusa TaxID=390896 RepID=A0A6A6INK2_9PLEO|nr:uncharacterized protein BU26DRAFT_516750 [Trematosphaeria pertusa]KAF2252041.1 hypothetical protein BU26DRAFT_516750 [Trematosphaeria pertusa]
MLESQPSRRPRAKDIIDGLWAGEAEGFCKPCRVMLSPPSLSPSNAEENQTTGFRPSGRRPKPTERLDNECSTSPDDQPSVCRKRKHSHLNPSPCLHGTPEAISSPFNGMPIFSAGKGCPRNPYHRVADGLDAFDDSNFDPGTSSMAPSPTRSRSRSSVGGASSKEPMLDITNRLEPIRNGPGAVPSASGVTQSLFPHDHRHPDPITPANPIHAQSRPSVPEEHRFILLGRHDAFQQPLCGPGYVSTRELRKLTRDIEERRRRRRAMAKVETPSMGQYSSRSEGTFADRTLNLKQAVSDAILN